MYVPGLALLSPDKAKSRSPSPSRSPNSTSASNISLTSKELLTYFNWSGLYSASLVTFPTPSSSPEYNKST